MTVRIAQTDDVPGIVELWKEFMDVNAGFDPGFARPEEGHVHWTKYLQEILADEMHHVMVAEEDGALVGYVVGIVKEYPPIISRAKYGYLQEIVVTDRCRRHGVAQAMYREVEKWFLARGVPQIELKIHVDNAASQGLFRGEGFAPRYETLIKKCDPEGPPA